jgi:hypothetical protein
MITAAAMFISHESSRKLAHEDAATVAIDRIQTPIAFRPTTSR